MELGTQVPGLSSFEDKSPPPVTQSPPQKKHTKHSTPEEMTIGWSPRPLGRASYLHGSPLPAHSSRDLVSQLAEVSPIATFRKRQLSTVWDSEGSSRQLGPYSDHSAAREDPPVSASLTQEQQPPQPREALSRSKSWQWNPGLPGIPDTARRKRRDWKAQTAAMRRLRQWEARLLQEIEEAVQHELTIQADRVPSPQLTFQAEEVPSTTRVTVNTDAQEPAALAQFNNADPALLQLPGSHDPCE